jgi:O-methyltransferase
MAAMTVVFREDYRKVWLCDSFEGLPEPSPAIYPADAGSVWYKYKQLAVDIESVERLFKSYGLNGENIRYVRGYFRDTLDLVTCDKIAVLRMDADMYESTIQVLNALLKRVQSGGYVIVDDYYAVPECKLAVDEYLAREHMSVSIKQIDWGGAFWRVE